MASQSRLEAVPVELLNEILSYLVFPRSRLAGLTERLSSYDTPPEEKRVATEAYSSKSASPPDTGRFAENLLTWPHLHPLNALALTSSHLRKLVEDFCAHLVRTDNIFNLPFALALKDGPGSVYPSLSNIVYRRLWLQSAPRYCVFCNRLVSSYPYCYNLGPLMTCGDCFYAQTLTLYEVEAHHHLSRGDLLQHNIRTDTWCLRIKIEALALKLYGTRKWHWTPPEAPRAPAKLCHICVEAGTLRRAAQHWPRPDGPPGWSAEPSGWIKLPNSSTNVTSSDFESKWPVFVPYRFDENLYEDGLDPSHPGDMDYIGHHLLYGRLTAQGLERYE
ncbi:hypothetical protein BDV96DRAFT_671898 [Lophiotrema nucula]|uniref:Uncharacterized protein n=1 Tax=Lophiotrema nucula TaxID=690887 RepID=A0A6A5ZRA3_9PLEO|nr:hypothetical protein BDV96DRAFT_671898 [Lophiotrema nucula]